MPMDTCLLSSILASRGRGSDGRGEGHTGGGRFGCGGAVSGGDSFGVIGLGYRVRQRWQFVAASGSRGNASPWAAFSSVFRGGNSKMNAQAAPPR